MFAGSIDSIPMKIQRPPDSAIRSTSSSSARRFALICATHGRIAPAAIISRKSPFNRFLLIARLSSMKKTAIWPLSLFARAFSRRSSSTTLSLVRNLIESPKKPVTVQNSQPYGQPRPVSIGTTKNLPHPAPSFDIAGRKNFGTKLNCSRSSVSHGMWG